jgi:co-chaperonin GroES (HSP10)
MGLVNIDSDNAVELVELGIQLEAVEDKIIVMMDSYKSGYECKECGGTGKVKSTVVKGAERDCEACNGKGATLVVPEISRRLPTLGTVMSVGEKTNWAKFLSGEWLDDQIDREALLSCAPQLSDRKKSIEKRIKIRPGAKVLFQPHVGTMIPFKGNIRLKIMREHEPLAVIYGTDIDARQFMDFDIPLEKQF